MLILVINSGSSSVKYQLYDMPAEKCIAKAMVEKIGQKDSLLHFDSKGKKCNKRKVKAVNHAEAVKLLIHSMVDKDTQVISSLSEIKALGHRVVHGGETFKNSVVINGKVINALKKYNKLAPLHNPPNITGINTCKRLFPKLVQVAVFDTAFHQSMPERAYFYALPYALYERLGIRRYGFHGTSHRYVAQEAAKKLKKPLKETKIITCHLGNGCSISAVDQGKSVDTSMGFTPLEGLVMGTRCGDLDPAAVLFIMKKKKMTIAQVDKLLNERSGLLGLSGKSNDMRDILLLVKKGNKRSRLALDVFIYRIKKYIGSYIAVMNGCDAVVFTAGIGENSKFIRNKIEKELLPLLKKMKTKVMSVATNEELVIARDTYHLVNKR